MAEEKQISKNLQKSFIEIKKNITDKIQDLPWETLSDKLFCFENTFDSQFLSLKKLIEKVKILVWKTSDPNFLGEYCLFLIIQNALICYQLSGRWEKYWQEFAVYLEKYIFENFKNSDFTKYFFAPMNSKEIDNDDFRNNNIEFWENFLSQCKNNRRFTSMKIKRIIKSLDILEDLSESFFWYYQNMDKLNTLIAKKMKQKENAKTVVFSIKMFGYGARVLFNQQICFPFKIQIPIDCRLTDFCANYLQKDKEEIKNKEIEDFYKKLSDFLEIPPLHLDALLWLKK